MTLLLAIAFGGFRVGGAVLALIAGIGLAPLALGIAADFGVDRVVCLARAVGVGFATVLTGFGAAICWLGR